MENLKTVKVMLVMVMGLFITNGIAQAKSDSNIPQAVVLSLNNKYPGAIVKKWKVQDDAYTAKTTVNGHTYFATFDKNGLWVNTASKINWPWGLPSNIRSAYKKSDYGAWNIIISKKIESPEGEFYELMVDNSELINHFPSTDIIPTNKLLKFKANGVLSGVKDVSAHPVLKF